MRISAQRWRGPHTALPICKGLWAMWGPRGYSGRSRCSCRETHLPVTIFYQKLLPEKSLCPVCQLEVLSHGCWNVITSELESTFSGDFNYVHFLFCELSGNLTFWASLKTFFKTSNMKHLEALISKAPSSLHILSDPLIFKNAKGNAVSVGKGFVGASQMREQTPWSWWVSLFLESSTGERKPGSLGPRQWWGRGQGERMLSGPSVTQ